MSASMIPDSGGGVLEEQEADVNADRPTGQKSLLGGIQALTHPNYHRLNVHCARNDRLLHAVLCAYAKWHLDSPDIGSEQLSTILSNAVCEEIGDNDFCEWAATIMKGK